jgi:hypothetical protein
MYLMNNGLKVSHSLCLQHITIPTPQWSSVSGKLIICNNPGQIDGTPNFSSIETQFGANCADCIKLGKWANTNQIPQMPMNLKISFFSSRHKAKLRPCLDFKNKDQYISPEHLVFDSQEIDRFLGLYN